MKSPVVNKSKFISTTPGNEPHHVRRGSFNPTNNENYHNVLGTLSPNLLQRNANL